MTLDIFGANRENTDLVIEGKELERKVADEQSKSQ